METTGAVGLGPGIIGALEGLDVIGTCCAMPFSVDLGLATFWISGLDTPVLWDDVLKGVVFSHSWVTFKEAFPCGIGSTIALLFFDRMVEAGFLGGLLGEDGTAVPSLEGLSTSAGSLMFSFFGTETTSYNIEKQPPVMFNLTSFRGEKS